MDRQSSIGSGADAVVPVSLYVLKVASRCNLNCKYCYMYNLGDTSYLDQPKVMSESVVQAGMDRIARHCEKHGLRNVGLVFHGGEPMLAGKDFFRALIEEARRRLMPAVTPRFVMQTNGMLLTPEWVDLLADLGVGFGISLDGPPEVNDQNRVDHAGKGSYAAVRAAIEMTLAHPRGKTLFGSVLTVVNTEVDPLSFFDHFVSMGLRGIDLLLPDGTHDNLPARVSLDGEETPYADWLIPIFDRWFERGDASFQVRFFENIIALVLGSPVSTDNIGGRPNDVLVIETDGGIEPVDVLKSCGHGFTKLGLNVLRNEIDDVFESELARMYQAGFGALCDTCKRCPVVDVCGGGYMPHRYRSKNGFANPSIYCRDLTKLITHIQRKTIATLPAAVRERFSLQVLDYTQVRAVIDASLAGTAAAGKRADVRHLPVVPAS